MNNIVHILRFEFWFRSSPNQIEQMILPVILFTLIFLIGFAAIFYNQKIIGNYPPKNKIFKPAAIGLIILGLTGLVFCLLTWQGISFLGVRFFLLVIFLLALFWSVAFIYLYQKRVAKEIIKYETRLIKQKYFKKASKG